MSHRSSEGAQATGIMRRRPGRGSALRGPGSLPGGRSFEEDLALFERQAREEAGQKNGSSAALFPPAALSA